jgi:flagellar basal body-associated protein FliL
MPDAVANAVTNAVTDLAEATKEFTTAVGQLKRRQTWVLMLLALTLVALAGIAALFWTVRDCTTEGGGCYERGRQQTGSAVLTIVECSRAADPQACVATRLGD